MRVGYGWTSSPSSAMSKLIVVSDPVFTVHAAPLDHRIVSMAYAVRERTHLNVRPDALAATGLRPGPWLNALKHAVRTGAADDTPIEVTPGDRRPLAAQARPLPPQTPPQRSADRAATDKFARGRHPKAGRPRKPKRPAV